MTVCGICGVAAAPARSGRPVHVDVIPKGIAEHEVGGICEQTAWEATHGSPARIAVAATELLAHHLSVHPASDCIFASRLADALRTQH